jgi:hypothetical protein
MAAMILSGPLQSGQCSRSREKTRRRSRDLRAALVILAKRGRAGMEEGGRRRAVAINPVLLDERKLPSAIGF